MRRCVENLLAGNFFVPPTEGGFFAPPSNRVWQGWITPFVGINVGGGFQGTNFSVDPQFTVSGGGLVYGGFGGVLAPIPNTNAHLGFRVGWEGMNISGRIEAPPASPFFDYTVRSTSMFYQEALAKVPLPGFDLRGSYVSGSVGIAEMQTSVNGTSGGFSATDNAYRTGVTFTAAIGTSLATLPNGAALDGFVQWRGTQWSGPVSIPGSVLVSPFTNEVSVGLSLALPPPQFKLWAPD